MPLELEPRLCVGVQSFLRAPPDGGEWKPRIAELKATVEHIDRCGYDSLWAGDHLSYPVPILDPLLGFAQAAAFSERLVFGTGVYLLPLRNPAPVAKQVATLDHLTEGRFIFGVGVGGEFAKEYELCGVPIRERGARLSDSIEVLRKLWSGKPVSHASAFTTFSDVPMQPPSRQAGGPPIWTGGRSDAALARAGRQADGWISYVVTPAMYRESLAKIEAAADEAGRNVARYGTGHLLFATVAENAERAFEIANTALSQRYAMDFSKATARYAALGRPAEVAAKIREFHAAGVRHVIVDFQGPFAERDRQAQWFAEEGLPLLADLR